jgi:hypothetical protein
MGETPTPSVTYFAQSILVSKTFWINVGITILAIAEAKDVINVLPPGVMKYVPSVVAVINILLRRTTSRPVRFMLKPGNSQPVLVKKL